MANLALLLPSPTIKKFNNLFLSESKTLLIKIAYSVTPGRLKVVEVALTDTHYQIIVVKSLYDFTSISIVIFSGCKRDTLESYYLILA